MTRTSCGMSNEMEADSRLPLDSVERPVEKEGKKVGRRETASGGQGVVLIKTASAAGCKWK